MREDRRVLPNVLVEENGPTHRELAKESIAFDGRASMIPLTPKRAEKYTPRDEAWE